MNLIILDGFGIALLYQNTCLALLQMLEDCYAEKVVLLASQIPITHWHADIAGPALADVISAVSLSVIYRLQGRTQYTHHFQFSANQQTRAAL